MKKTIFFSLLLISLSIRYAYAQSSIAYLPDSSMIISLEKTEGFGPQGQMSVAIGSSDLQDAKDQSLYPKLINIPKLQNVKSYFFVYNMPQFYYQSYKSGKLSESSFIEFYKKRNIELSDTISLSKSPINTVISVITAQDSTGKEVFLVDANHNADLSDDLIRTLTEQNYVSNLSELVCKIWIEAFSNQKVSEENISLVIRKSRSNSDK
uniref:hypothetical protein n=1 Tax=Pedobacter sp. TaxID=1411316 RepID=UPI003D7F4B30